ncbi:hypothetical protein QM012_009122 [Aureobasidium pullulans]|uniref:GPI ethanolamine phosphate transferase 1 n=1 Tax=Aureobasidium pullulans TaxID=5580 RepID=A0ABR0TIW2_AURPU
MAPFLRSRVLHHGTFGVSHTRVPTESRPGHVALIAGLYEDVGAVTTGWKLNHVNFDSVFNRSRHTWCWGSPDILPMFSTGAVQGRVETHMYAPEFEDYSKDATELDRWVFDHVKQLFKDAETDQALNERLWQNRIVFFLHLLGLDTTGHFYRPYSQEYLRNIQVVDKGVQEITQIIEDFYGDGKTAFVFTADHGMSDWGSHGDGHPDNTRTPLIAWGSGVAKPKTVRTGETASGHGGGFSKDWQLDHVNRHDVSQADIAPLMAYLAGIEFPTNSVGELPLPFLDATDEHKAKALLVNAKQILEMYHVKEHEKRAQVMRYKPYPGFTGTGSSVDARLASVDKFIREEDYESAIRQTYELIEVTLQGLRYLQTYAWLFLRTLVTMGYLVLFWEEVFARSAALIEGKTKLFSETNTTRVILSIAASLAFLEAMVQSYYHRQIYTIVYLIATAWPLFYGATFVKSNLGLRTTWIFSCSAMSVFTLLLAKKIEDLTLILIGGSSILLLGLLYIVFEKKLLEPSAFSKERDTLSTVILGLQVALVGLAMLVTKSSVTSLQAKRGLPKPTQILGWATLSKSHF